MLARPTRLNSLLLALVVLGQFPIFSQETSSTSKPTDRIIGAVTTVDHSSHKVTVKEDKTAAEYTVDLTNTKTLLKVEPGAKSLAGATRITADDLEVGDRVQVGGAKTEGSPNTINARSIILMSGRDLQQAHQAEAAAWQHSKSGIVSSVNAATGTILASIRTPEGIKPSTIDVSSAEFTRYSPDSPKTPVRSSISDIQPSDHILVIGEGSTDESTIRAQKLYSGAFRTINGSVISVSSDGKQVTVKNLATNKPVQIVLSDESAIHRLPLPLAMGLARRLNPDFKPTQGAAGADAQRQPNARAGASQSSQANIVSQPPPSSDAQAQSGGPGRWQGPSGQGGGMRGGRNGDISQLIERLPKISVSDLKPGDAVVIAGVATGTDNSRLLATNVIAGVEPILQSAPRRQGRQGATGDDWGLGEMTVPQ